MEKITRTIYITEKELNELQSYAAKLRMSWNQFMIKAGFEKIERDKENKK